MSGYGLWRWRSAWPVVGPAMHQRAGTNERRSSQPCSLQRCLRRDAHGSVGLVWLPSTRCGEFGRASDRASRQQAIAFEIAQNTLHRLRRDECRSCEPSSRHARLGLHGGECSILKCGQAERSKDIVHTYPENALRSLQGVTQALRYIARHVPRHRIPFQNDRTRLRRAALTTLSDTSSPVDAWARVGHSSRPSSSASGREEDDLLASVGREGAVHGSDRVVKRHGCGKIAVRSDDMDRCFGNVPPYARLELTVFCGFDRPSLC